MHLHAFLIISHGFLSRFFDAEPGESGTGAAVAHGPAG